MRLALLLAVAALPLNGCGVYLHRGGGAYSFVGPGSHGVALRCDPERAGNYFTGKCLLDKSKRCPKN